MDEGEEDLAQDRPDPEMGAINSFADPEIAEGKAGKHSWRRVRVTLDSGASVSVAPATVGEQSEVTDDGTGQNYVTADGSKVEDVGSFRLAGVDETWNKCLAKFRVTRPPVRKPLLAASQVIAKGNRIVLDESGSYILFKATGRRMPLRLENGVFVFDLWIKETDRTRGAPAVGPEPAGEVSPGTLNPVQGFPRRVSWRL
jgi:hypothetical protein